MMQKMVRKLRIVLSRSSFHNLKAQVRHGPCSNKYLMRAHISQGDLTIYVFALCHSQLGVHTTRSFCMLKTNKTR